MIFVQKSDWFFDNLLDLHKDMSSRGYACEAGDRLALFVKHIRPNGSFIVRIDLLGSPVKNSVVVNERGIVFNNHRGDEFFALDDALIVGKISKDYLDELRAAPPMFVYVPDSNRTSLDAYKEFNIPLITEKIYETTQMLRYL